jgi:hypothetical protein
MQHPGKAPSDQVEHHRLSLDEDGVHGRGFAMLDGPTRAMLHELRWRRPARDSRRFVAGVVLTIVLHALLVLFVSYEMMPRVEPPRVFHVSDEDVLQVRLMDAPAPTPPPAAAAVEPPPPPPLPKVLSPEATRPMPPRPPPPREAPAKDAMTATVQAPAPATSSAPQLHLFGSDGRVIMPTATPGQGATPDYVQNKPTGDSQVMEHQRPVQYTETRFEKDWAPKDETIADTAVRRTVDKTSLKKTFSVGGSRFTCATVLFVLPVGCSGEAPSKGAKKDGDVRLSMAPANPLVKDLPPDPNRPVPPTEAECIAIFRADKPLPQGCATDVPLKAMDQQNEEIRRRTR